MSKKQKKYIRYSKERAILSDVLPYEVPLIFSNRYFYRLLVNQKLELVDKALRFQVNYSASTPGVFEEILRLLFDMKYTDTGQIKTTELEFSKIPFQYKIAHKDSDFRSLTVIHPFNQLHLVQLYEKYKEQILYYCKVSKFSIRRPDTTAKFMFFNDKLHYKNRGNNDDFLELKGKEYENLKSFFAYKKYTNIHRFYEDYRYQRAEKKFKILYKFDVTKCFDSIYTHSLVWALINKEIVKDIMKPSKGTFPGEFDRFMQSANYGETNGIVIGPEFSRIFAELLLQQIDKSIETKLREANLFQRKDYEIYRYVDDFFLFCDTELTKEFVIKTVRHELKEYKMSLNDTKGKPYVKPMVTEISIAKQKINQLFENEPRFKITENGAFDHYEEEDEEEVTIINKHIFRIHINSNKLALKFKIIIKEANVEYKDVLNYTLAILNNKIEKILSKFELHYKKYNELEHKGKLSEEDLSKKKNLENRFSKFIVGYIDFVFFLYSVSPRVNSSIKLATILAKIITYYKGAYKVTLAGNQKGRVFRMKEMNVDLVFKKISDDSSLILERHQMDKHTQIEELYLLIILRELGRHYRINPNQLARYFNCWDKEQQKIFIPPELNLNYFSITVLLFYIRNIEIYRNFKEELKKYILSYISLIDKDKRRKNTEPVLLVLDLMVCPYLDESFKGELLQLFGIPVHLIPGMIAFKEYQKYWFIKWENFDLVKELNSKNSEEVYS